jgi:hypothetical protein
MGLYLFVDTPNQWFETPASRRQSSKLPESKAL